MKKDIVIYYSNKGNNTFIAKKISTDLNCELEKIRPNINLHFFVLFGLSKRIKNIKANIAAYERIILVGPVWMGKFISPLKAFVKKYISDINKLVFVCCCASSEAQKNEKYGHGLVFKEVQEMLGEKCVHCESFPVGLILNREQQKDPKTVMGTSLNNENFNGAILDKYNAFIEKINN